MLDKQNVVLPISMEKICQVCNKKFEKSLYSSRLYWKRQKYCSQKCCGIDKLGRPSPRRGCILSSNTKAKISVNLKKYWSKVVRIYKNNQSERRSKLYLEWHDKVLKRDNYTCQVCGDHNYKGRGGAIKFHVHHKETWSTNPELRFDVNNGVTMCIPCHLKTDDYGWRQFNKIRQHANA